MADYRRHLLNRGRKAGTVNTALEVLRCFFGWLKKEKFFQPLATYEFVVYNKSRSYECVGGVTMIKDLVGYASWAEGATARVQQYPEGTVLTVTVPLFGGGLVVKATPDGVSGWSNFDRNCVWEEWAGEDYGLQKEIYWHLAELLTDALEWAREQFLEAGFPEIEHSDWRETDFGWLSKKDGILIRLDPEDGLVVTEDPFALLSR